MSGAPTARAWLALLALALGGFGIGTTEFVAMGVLPQLAADLLPGLAATDPEAAYARAGIVISAYAAGVVVGAPTIAVVAARFPRKGLLLVLVTAFAVTTLLSVAAPTFELVVVARFLAGLPHGAYFGVAALVAAELLGPGRRGQGVALVLAGLTIANVVGVPGITAVGQAAGWRTAYLVVAVVFVVTAAAIALVVPRQPGDPAATIRRELAGFARPALWVTLLMASIGFSGLFAVYTYVAPLTTEVAGLDAGAVPAVLVVMGVGMTLGTLLGGRLADAGAQRAIYLGFGSMALALLLLALTSWSPVGLVAGLFAVGASTSVLVPAVQTRLMDVAPDSQTLAAASNHSALNLGNSFGAFVGGAVIAAGWGYVAPTWVGVALVAPGILLALIGGALTRRSRSDRPG